MTHRRLQITLLGVFVLSGFSALLYQMAWQRALMTIYGSHMESVAMVSSAFLTGLGLGSLLGGHLSSRPRFPLVLGFAIAELGVAAYGISSLRLFDVVGTATAVGSANWLIGLMAFALIFIPTMLMGATLPLLVEYFVRETGRVGASVSLLYGVNTIGGALGAVVAVMAVLGTFGLQGSVTVAAGLNLAVVGIVSLGAWRVRTGAAS